MPASAHDAWIEVSLENVEAGSKAAMETYIGHAEERDHYNPSLSHVSRYYLVNEAGVKDQLGIYSVFEGRDQVPLNPKMLEGDAYLVMSTFRAKSTLEAEKFNGYIEEEGIKPIIDFRAANEETDQPGREVYSRHMKAMLVAPGDDCDISFLSGPVGETLEIVPMVHPGKACGDELVFRLHYMGKPVSGGMLHLNRTDEAMEPIKAMTDDEGVARFERPGAGNWYVHAAWARPVDADTYDAEFATNFASLSFSLAD